MNRYLLAICVLINLIILFGAIWYLGTRKMETEPPATYAPQLNPLPAGIEGKG